MKLDINGSHTLFDLLMGWREHRRTFELPRAAEHDQEAFRWLFETLDNLSYHERAEGLTVSGREPSEPASPTTTPERCQEWARVDPEDCACFCHQEGCGRTQCNRLLPCPSHPSPETTRCDVTDLDGFPCGGSVPCSLQQHIGGSRKTKEGE